MSLARTGEIFSQRFEIFAASSRPLSINQYSSVEASSALKMQESAIMENRRMTRHDRRVFERLVLTKGGGYSIQLSGEINGIIRRRESHGIFEARSSGRDGKIYIPSY